MCYLYVVMHFYEKGYEIKKGRNTMKTRFQKLTSLVLVLVMLLTMIPMGAIVATAEVSAELAAGLADYDNTTEFVINSVDDWNAIAATTHQFDGKTVKLGADIDAEGATLPQLFACGNVRCTFDGQGYAIKNVGTAETPNTTALFSNKSNLNVQNLTVENCHVAGAGNKGLLVDWQNCWAKYTFKNIKVLNSSVVSTDKAAAIFAGYCSGNGAGYGVDFENILISNSTAEGTPAGGYGWNASGVAALVGYTVWNATDVGYSVKNVEITGCTFTDNATKSAAGGLFGYIRQNTNVVGITVENVYVNATLVTPNSAGWTGVAAGLFYSDNSSTGNTITLKNVITNNTYPGIVQVPTLFYSAQATFVTENLYSVQNTTKSGWTINGGNTINGVTGIASSYTGIPAEIVTAATVPYMITRNADGFITNVAMPTGMAADLMNYDSVSTFVINSVDDWKLVAASGKTFSGKTVQLGQDLNAEGATLPTLAPFAVNNSSITLDGNGYAIKNVGTAGAPQTEPLVSGKFSGGTVKNVTFQNVVMVGTDATYGSGLIADFLNGWGTVTVQNVKVLGCDISDTAGSAGALFGRTINNNGECFVNIDGVIVDASTKITATTHAGSVIGHISGNGGTYNVNRVYTEATMTAPAASGYVGGLIGYMCGHGSYTSQFNFNHNVVKAALIADGGSGWTGRAGAICGRATTAVDINVYNCIMAPSQLPGGLVLRQAVTAANGSQDLDIRNSYYNNMFMSVFYAENSNSTLNGAAKASGHWYTLPGALSLGAADDAKLATLYKTDANGFIINVHDFIDAEGIQYSQVENGKYAIRFIAMSQLAEASNVKMTVIATYVEGGNTVNRKFEMACTLYDALSVYSAQGIGTRKTAEEYNAEKLAGLTIYNIPTGTDITFTVTTSYTDANGLVVTGANAMTVNFNAAGEYVPAN